MKPDSPRWPYLIALVSLVIFLAAWQLLKPANATESTLTPTVAGQFSSVAQGSTAVAVTTSHSLTVRLQPPSPVAAILSPLLLSPTATTMSINRAESSIIPTDIAAILPAKAEPLDQLAWQPSSGCGQNLRAIPYRRPKEPLSLAVIKVGLGSTTPFWDWRQEQGYSMQWLELRQLPNSNLQNGLAFLGRDMSNHWWIGIVVDFCHSAYLDALLPTTDPAHVSLTVANAINEPESVGYWVVENDTLTSYNVVNHQAVRQWTWKGARRTTVTPMWQDVTGDGKPEIILVWGWSPQSLLNQQANSIGPYQIFQPEGDGYKLVGEIEAGVQLTDFNGDGIFEFLRPNSMDSPTSWDVYQWQGNHFVWGKALARPIAPTPGIPNLQALPALLRNLYFKRDQAVWMWPRAGGQLQLAAAMPEPIMHQCNTSTGEMQLMRVGSFSPDCVFKVVDVSHYIEGSNSAIRNLQTNKLFEIPNSFVYVRGLSTFAWDPQSHYIIYARADGGEGLYRIELNSDAQSTLLPLSSAIFSNFGESRYYGAVGPVVLAHGTVGFTIQSANPWLYPPSGIYRMSPTKALTLLADVPKLKLNEMESANYGVISWSPDGLMFLYSLGASAVSDDSSSFHFRYLPPYDVLLLGMTDGSGLWDLRPILNNAEDFRWQP